MGAAPCSRTGPDGPNGSISTPLQGQWLQQGPQHPSVLQLTGPSAFTFPTSTTPYVYFPTSQPGTNAFNVSHDLLNPQRYYELHDHSVHSRPISNHLSESRLHLPPQSSQIHFPLSNGQISGDSQATSNSGEKTHVASV